MSPAGADDLKFGEQGHQVMMGLLMVVVGVGVHIQNPLLYPKQVLDEDRGERVCYIPRWSQGPMISASPQLGGYIVPCRGDSVQEDHSPCWSPGLSPALGEYQQEKPHPSEKWYLETTGAGEVCGRIAKRTEEQ